MKIEQLESYRSDEIIKSITDDKNEHARLEKRCNETLVFVNSIPDEYSKVREMIRMRYISGKRTPSWQYVAMCFNYRSEHTPKRKIEKFLENGGNGGKINL